MKLFIHELEERPDTSGGRAYAETWCGLAARTYDLAIPEGGRWPKPGRDDDWHGPSTLAYPEGGAVLKPHEPISVTDMVGEGGRSKRLSEPREPISVTDMVGEGGKFQKPCYPREPISVTEMVGEGGTTFKNNFKPL